MELVPVSGAIVWLTIQIGDTDTDHHLGLLAACRENSIKLMLEHMLVARSPL